MVPQQRATFHSDEFLSSLSNQSRMRFSLFEHAPVEERRQRLVEALIQRRLHVTFLDSGVNLIVDLAEVIETNETQVEIESAVFIFNGVCVRLRGSLNKIDLDGTARLEIVEASMDEMETMTPEQLRILRDFGLP